MPLAPDPLALLEATCNSLRERVVPALNGPERYEALLAISAIGIVIRELSGEPERSRAESEDILSLQNVDTPASDQNLAALETRLADSIRDGAFAAPEDARNLWKYLDESCRRALNLTSPKVAATYNESDNS